MERIKSQHLRFYLSSRPEHQTWTPDLSFGPEHQTWASDLSSWPEHRTWTPDLSSRPEHQTWTPDLNTGPEHLEDEKFDPGLTVFLNMSAPGESPSSISITQSNYKKHFKDINLHNDTWRIFI